MRATSYAIGGAFVLLAIGCGPSSRPGNGGGDDDGVDASPPAIDAPTGDNTGTTYVYAHSSSTLYKIDPDTLAVTMVGNFGWPNGFDQMTDLAIDRNGQLIGISFGSVYRVDPNTAQATLLSSNLSGEFNGLSFVPADMLGQTGDDILIATRNSDGNVFRIDPMTGAATQVGDMGSQFQSSGDLVAVEGFGTVQTTLGAPFDMLSKLAPITFHAMPAPQSTGFGQIWGVAYWKGKVFGFTQSGQFVTIDPQTGQGTVVQSNGPEWWGAAVTTIAPILQ
ncbi:MAG TPA: hypothetical protein VFQ53_40570 [Kofleriaceae bacterium]|nr:hypothetical protein [Kofleriaceae bacterium]